MDIDIPVSIMQLMISSGPRNGDGPWNSGAGALLPNDMFLPSFVQSFAHYDYRSDFAETVNGKHNCDWIFDVDEMKWWVEGRNTPVRILWLTGHPGIGKSTLASHVVENYLTHIDQVKRQSTTVIYSFCHYQKNNTASMVLAVAIHQLLREFPNLQNHAFQTDVLEGLDITKHRIRKAKHRNHWPLWRLFNTLISRSEMDEIVLVVDGFNVLDRCHQQHLMEVFGDRSKARDCRPRLKVFITSVPDIPSNEHRFKWLIANPNSLKHIEANQYEHHFTAGIEALIAREKIRLREVHGYMESHLLAIDAFLATQQRKIYLPVKLYFNHLAANSPKHTGKVMRDFSLDLSRINAELVSRLPKELLSTPTPLATFVTYACTVLNLQELAFLCKWYDHGVDKPSPFLPRQENPIEPQYIQHITVEVQRYYPILKIYEDQVAFFHDSIRDFVLQRAAHDKNFLVTSHKEAHTQLALMCIGTVLYKSRLQVPETWHHDANSRYALKSTSHVFLSYAMRFWLVHLQKAVPNGTPIEDIDKGLIMAVKSMINLWSPSSNVGGFRAIMLSEFSKTHDFGSTHEDLSPLEVLSAVGLEPFLRLYVANIDPESHRRLGNSVVHSNAIKLALKGGHDDCFDFLERAFNITSLEGEQYSTVLQDTARKGHTRLLGKVMRMRRSLVKDLVVALIEAFLNGHKVALDELTKDYAIFRDKDHFGMNALHAVFAYDHGTFSHPNDAINVHDGNINACVAICEYLISHGVDPSSRDRNGFTALHWACRNRAFCRKAIVQVLVSNGASVSEPAFGGLTPFHLAAYYAEDADVLSYLLELSSKQMIGAASDGGMTPLHWAISRPTRTNAHYDTLGVLEYLLRQGADIHAKNLRGISPLEWGGTYRKETVQAIWSGLNGVDLISITYNFRTGTAILWAAWSEMSPDTLPEPVPEMIEGSAATQSDQEISESEQMHSQGHQPDANGLRSWTQNHRHQTDSEQCRNSRPWLVRLWRPTRSSRHDQEPTNPNTGFVANQPDASPSQEQRVLHSNDLRAAEGSQELVRLDGRRPLWSRLDKPLRWWPRKRT